VLVLTQTEGKKGKKISKRENKIERLLKSDTQTNEDIETEREKQDM